jgi:hypothetical protein
MSVTPTPRKLAAGLFTDTLTRDGLGGAGGAGGGGSGWAKAAFVATNRVAKSNVSRFMGIFNPLFLPADINRAARTRQAKQRATTVDSAFRYHQRAVHPDLHGWEVGYDALQARGRFNLR